MNNKEKLLLFTSGFPFGHGESFLENELPFLANSFSEIIIFSKNPATLDKPRKVPANCKVVPLNFGNKSFKHLFKVLNFSLINELLAICIQQNGFAKLKITLDQLLISYQTKLALENHTTKHEFQVAYSYWLDDSALAFAHVKSNYPNTRFISRAHGWDVYFERHPFNFLPLRSYLSRNLDAIFFISENGLSYFNKIPRTHANSLMISRLGTLNDNPMKVLPKVSSEYLIVSCSSLIPLKRIHLLIEALSLLKFPFHWIHFGNGPLYTETKVLAQEKLSPENYSFKGWVSNEAVKDYYKNNSIDVFINVSSTEGVPVSMMEALSFSIPCIGTNVGGVSEIIQNDHNGFLLDANPSPSDISLVLTKHYALGPESKDKMQKASFNFWNNTFNANKNYTVFIQTISNL